MSSLKSYIGSVILAGLLLQGCGDSQSKKTPDNGVTAAQKFDTVSQLLSGSSSEEKTQAESDLTLKIISLDNTNSEVTSFIDKLMTDNNLTTRLDAYQALASAITTQNTRKSSSVTGLLGLGTVTNKIGDSLVNVLDTKVGDAITGAAFNVVLNSDGITVTMLDLARKSEKTSQIMVNSIEAKWELTEKMCPMLQENQEFGEKFTALAEEKDFVGRFFFERIDAIMYNWLADAMLLSNDYTNLTEYKNPISHSTNGYMGLMMER